MDDRERLMVARYKIKERDRLTTLVLSKLSYVEKGLRADPQMFPTRDEARGLWIAIEELRATILTYEEKEAMHVAQGAAEMPVRKESKVGDHE